MPSEERESSRSLEVRLHPLSILFSLGGELRNLAIPIIAGLFALRQTNRNFFVQFLIVLVAALIAATWRYFSFRMQYDEDELIIRSGIIRRNERHIPYNRVQNIDTRRNMFHQLFGVADVVIQTAGGDEPEAKLSVLPVASIGEIRERVFRNRGHAKPAFTGEAGELEGSASPEILAAAPQSEMLLRLSSGDLWKYGFIENRGFFLIAAALGLLLEFGLADRLETSLQAETEDGGPIRAFLAAAFSDGGLPMNHVVVAIIAVLAILILVRVLSVVWAAVRLHEFTVSRVGDDLRVEYGLFTRVAGTVPMKRIQSVNVREMLAHRLFGCATIDVSTAGGGGGAGEGGRISEPLVPVIPVERVPDFLRLLWPSLDLSGAEWRPLHPRAHVRIFRSGMVAALVVTLLLFFLLRWFALVYLVGMGVYHLYSSRKKAKTRSWTIHQNVFAARGGWLRRVADYAWLNKVQVVEMTETYFDRRTGMAGIRADTGGDSAVVSLISRESAQAALLDLSLAAGRAP